MSSNHLSNTVQIASAASTHTDDVNEIQNLALQLVKKYAGVLFGFPVEMSTLAVDLFSELSASDHKWYVTGLEIRDISGTRFFKVLGISLEFSEAKATLTILQTNTSGADAFLEQLFAGDQEFFGSDVTRPYEDEGPPSYIPTGAGNDTVHGGAADERVHRSGPGKLIFDGGKGNDTVDYFDASFVAGYHGIKANLVTGIVTNPFGGTDKLTRVENVLGTLADDVITGNSLDNLLAGSFGNDTLSGKSGDDALLGNEGNDKLYGGDGNDELEGGEGADVMDGGKGFDSANFSFDTGGLTNTTVVDLGNGANNTKAAAGDIITGIELFRFFGGYDKSASVDFRGDANAQTVETNRGSNNRYVMRGGDDAVMDESNGAVFVDGGNGFDRFTYNNIFDGITLDLVNPSKNLGAAVGDTFQSIEAFALTRGNDIFWGDAGANVVNSGGNSSFDGGVDILHGRGGDDTLIGDDHSNDIFYGDSGNDTLIGGPEGYGSIGRDDLYGGNGSDTVSYSTATSGVIANLGNTSGNTGDAKGDKYFSIENLTGSNFTDVLTGNTKANIITGGLGADTLKGGLGADIFHFNMVSDTGKTSANWDVITDFKTSEQDRIDLSDIDANSATAGKNEAFIFIGTAAFSNTNATGQLRFDAAAHLLYGSTDADNAAEFAIQLNGVNSLASANFLL